MRWTMELALGAEVTCGESAAIHERRSGCVGGGKIFDYVENEGACLQKIVVFLSTDFLEAVLDDW